MKYKRRYIPLSMIVDTGEEWIPPHAFFLMGPKDIKPSLSRVIFHETIHYWQYIGHTYLINLIEEDWARLMYFDKTGEIKPPGDLRKRFSLYKKEIGFSTNDLLEALARFWDVQALGPPLLIELELNHPNRNVSKILTRVEYNKLKENGNIWHHFDENGQGVGYTCLSFDLAMRMSAGRYAIPYLQLRDKTDDLTAAALFPLCAHFALHSNSPPEFYNELLKRLIPQVDLKPGRVIEEAWRYLYIDVWREAALLHIELYGYEFYTGQATIHKSRLFNEHVGYNMTHKMLSMACDHLLKNRPKRFLIGSEQMPLDMRALWTMDFLLGCCGMGISRSPDILAFISPPVIRFNDNLTWNIGKIFDQYPYASSTPITVNISPPREQIESGLLAIDYKWTKMLENIL